MLSIGSDFDIADFLDVVTSPHRVRRSVTLMDLSHNVLDDLTDRLEGGQMNFDMDADITRSAPMSFIDPTRQIDLDGDTPEAGTMHLKYMISVDKIYTSVLTGKTFEVPLITGPIRKFERNEGIISAEVQGKELLANRLVWNSRTYKEGTYRNAIIRDLMTDAGEDPSMMRIPTSGGGKLGKDLIVGNDMTYWKAAQSVAADMGCQLFYDGRGILQLRRWSGRPVIIKIHEPLLLDKPVFSYDVDNLVNAVEYIGGKPSGANLILAARAVAPSSHPLSPRAMRRNGRDSYYPSFIKNDKVRTQAEVNRRALNALNDGLLEVLQVDATIVDLSVLEPGDTLAISYEDAFAEFRLRKASVGFFGQAEMVIGYHKNISVGRKASLRNVRNTSKRIKKKSTKKSGRKNRRGRRRRRR